MKNNHVFLKALIICSFLFSTNKPMVTISTCSLLISGGLVTTYLLQREPNKSVCQRAENLIFNYQKTNFSKILQISEINNIKAAISKSILNESKLSNLLKELNNVHWTVNRRYNTTLKPWNKTVLMASIDEKLNIVIQEASLIETLLQYSKIINTDHLTMDQFYSAVLAATEKDNLYPLMTLYDKIESGLQFIQSQKQSFRYTAFPALQDHLQTIQNKIKCSAHYIAEKRSRNAEQGIKETKTAIEQITLKVNSAQMTAQSAQAQAMATNMRR